METAYGEISVKLIVAPNGSIRMAPEYEVCRKIALENKHTHQNRIRHDCTTLRNPI